MKTIHNGASRKLHLDRQTVRLLRSTELERAVGGFHPVPSIDCSSATLACTQ